MRAATSLLVVLIVFSLAFVHCQPRGYQSLDGSDNNVDNPARNAAEAPYVRLMPLNSYVDGFGELDTSLPNERIISNRLFEVDNGVATVTLNGLHLGFGQLFSHDVQEAGGDLREEIETLGETIKIPIPTGDPFFDPYHTGTKTFSFKRRNFGSNSGPGTNTVLEVLNLVSPSPDLSPVYGISMERLDVLRNPNKRRYLKTGETKLGEPCLPFNTEDINVHMENVYRVNTTTLYAAGDSQANQNSYLLVFHHLFALEHNRLADQLAEKHDNWSEEKLFWEARRWNIAQYQAICFNEYLPTLAGGPLPVYEGYNPDLDVSTSMLFNTGFRGPHSNIPSLVLIANEARQILTSVRLREAYFNPSLVDRFGLANIVRGMSIQEQENTDLSYSTDVRNFLFGDPGEGGIDLAALCVFRARDQGIPYYNDVREYLGMPRISYFEEVVSNYDVALSLEELYGHPDRAEMFVMGLAEDTKGGFMGPTFTAIIQQGAQRFRNADRFYFENEDAGFDDDEIEEIARTTVADIILRNTDVQQIQCSAFFVSEDFLGCGDEFRRQTEQASELLSTQAELLGGDIILSWEIVDTNINFKVKAETSGWVAIAIASNPGNMVGADAMIGFVDGSTAFVQDYKITARAVGCAGVCLDTEDGGTNNIVNPEGQQIGSTTYLSWTRALNTGDGSDEPITEGNVPIVFAMSSSGSDTLAYHGGKKGAAEINFFTGEFAQTGVVEGNEGANRRLTAHGWLMFIAWTVIFPIGIFAVKFCRKILPRWWFRLHMFLQYFGVFVIVIALILAIEAVADLADRKHFHNAHGIMGLITVSLAIITPALGQATAVMYEAPKRVPLFPDRAHSLMGYFSPIVAYATIFLGIHENDSRWFWFLLAAIWIAFVTVAYWTTFISQFLHQYYISNKNKKANMAISEEEAAESWSE